MLLSCAVYISVLLFVHRLLVILYTVCASCLARYSASVQSVPYQSHHWYLQLSSHLDVIPSTPEIYSVSHIYYIIMSSPLLITGMIFIFLLYSPCHICYVSHLLYSPCHICYVIHPLYSPYHTSYIIHTLYSPCHICYVIHPLYSPCRICYVIHPLYSPRQ